MKTANQILAENLKRLMAERGLNNSTLGAKAQLAPNTIKNYCDADRDGSAKLSDVEKIAQALKVPFISLLSEQAEAAPFPAALTARQEQMLLDLDALPPPRQDKLLDLVHQEAETARATIAHALATGRLVLSPAAAPSAAAMRSPYPAATMSVKYGDGNERQAALPLVVAPNPFDPAAATEREQAWYRQLEQSKDRQ